MIEGNSLAASNPGLSCAPSSAGDQAVRDLELAALCLVLGRPRRAAAQALVRCADQLAAVSRLAGDDAANASLIASARHRTIEAALWLAAGRSRIDVASALLSAIEQLDSAEGPPTAPGTTPVERDSEGLRYEQLFWNHRLSTWRQAGGAVNLTGLLDRLLDRCARGHGIAPVPLVAQWVEEKIARGAAPDDDTTSPWADPVTLDVTGVGEVTRVPAHDFLSIEEQLRWLPGPGGTYGLVAGRPVRTVMPAEGHALAVRCRVDADEQLLPFGSVCIRGAFE